MNDQPCSSATEATSEISVAVGRRLLTNTDSYGMAVICPVASCSARAACHPRNLCESSLTLSASSFSNSRITLCITNCSAEEKRFHSAFRLATTLSWLPWRSRTMSPLFAISSRIGLNGRGTGPCSIAMYWAPVMGLPSSANATKSQKNSILFNLVAPKNVCPSHSRATSRISSSNFFRSNSCMPIILHMRLLLLEMVAYVTNLLSSNLPKKQEPP